MDALEELNAKQREKIDKREKKRVRFTGDQDSDDEEDKRPKQALFPKGKKSVPSVKELVVNAEGGPILAADPRVAALERATRRKEVAELADEGGGLEDVAGAEEDIEGVEEEEEAALEPFNLKKEREEGFFDAEGNYVEYRLENEITDAWLDNAEVDTRFASKAAERMAASGQEEAELSAAEIANVKQRIADALQPGETVLEGLRRLGGTSKQQGRGGRGGRGGGRGGAWERMRAESKAEFDKLTEDAMALMDKGEYGVYSEKKETFVREADEGYHALARARAAPSSGGGDMFASDEDEPTEPPAKRQAREALPGGNQAEAREGGNGAAAGAANGGVSSEPPSSFVWDQTSGYHYNAETGYYYDGASGLFGNATTGQWYRYEEGTGVYTEATPTG